MNNKLLLQESNYFVKGNNIKSFCASALACPKGVMRLLIRFCLFTFISIISFSLSYYAADKTPVTAMWRNSKN